MNWIVNGKSIGTMYDFYYKYLVDFGDLLTELEKNGIKGKVHCNICSYYFNFKIDKVDTKNHLKLAESKAREEKLQMEQLFLNWAKKICPDVEYINIGSSQHIQQLLFGHYEEGQRISLGMSS